MSPADVFRPAPGVSTATFSGEKVLLDPQGRTLRGLNVTGARVWELLDGRRSVQDIARALAAERGIDEARALTDVSTFLAQLSNRGLIVTP